MKKFSLALLPMAIAGFAVAEQVVENEPRLINNSAVFDSAALENSGNWQEFDSSTLWFNPANLSNYNNQLSINARSQSAALVIGEETTYFAHYGQATTIGTDSINIGWASGNLGAVATVATDRSKDLATTSITVNGTTVALENSSSFTYQDSAANSSKYEFDIAENSKGTNKLLAGVAIGTQADNMSMAFSSELVLDRSSAADVTYIAKETQSDGTEYVNDVDAHDTNNSWQSNNQFNLTMPMSETRELISIVKVNYESESDRTYLKRSTKQTGSADFSSESDEQINTAILEGEVTANLVSTFALKNNVAIIVGQGISAGYQSETTETEVVTDTTNSTKGRTGISSEDSVSTMRVSLPFNAKLQAQMTPSFVARAGISGDVAEWSLITATTSDFEDDDSNANALTYKVVREDILVRKDHDYKAVHNINASFGFAYTPIAPLTIDVNISSNSLVNAAELTATYSF